MYETESIEIQGYRNERVPNTFFWQKEETDHLAIILPGMGYTSHMPVLYYPGRLLLALGADLLRLDYEYSNNPEFLELPGPDRAEWLMTDASAAYKTVSSSRPYQKVTLIGKSIGTLAMGHLLTRETLFEKVCAVWLTPLIRNEKLRKQIREGGQASLFIIGTADPQYDAHLLREVQDSTQGESLVIEGADHSLEIRDDLLRSLKAMEMVIEAIAKFVE
jgi:hypothetical protein